MQGGAKSALQQLGAEDKGKYEAVEGTAVFFRIKEGISGELIAIGQNSSLAKPLGQILGLHGIMMDRDQEVCPPLVGDRGSGREGDISPGLIDDKRAFKSRILKKSLMQQGADVMIEEIFRGASGAGGSGNIDGVAYIDGNDKILSPTSTAYRGQKNQTGETVHYQGIKHLRRSRFAKISLVVQHHP